jgi:NADPH-dependent ferric siderophore reductase
MTDPQRVIRRVRHEPKLRMLEVVATQAITPRMIRVTLHGEELEGFTSLGFDDHVKLFFPAPGEVCPSLPESQLGDAANNAPKPIARDYTPRRYDAHLRQLEIEFALHDSGPATAWAAQARPAQILGVGGPRGLFIIPEDFEWHVLIGDETALPAINRRLEELPSGVRAIVVAEVDSIAEQQQFATAAQLDTIWLHRNGEDAGSDRLILDALRRLHLPDQEVFVWMAGESTLAKAVRRYWLDERGMSKDRVKAAGYWKRGAVAVHEKHDD